MRFINNIWNNKLEKLNAKNQYNNNEDKKTIKLGLPKAQ
jgi:hypothetical protein